MLWTIFIGLIIGAFAKLLMPGKDPGGIIVTISIGILGSVVARWIGVGMGTYEPDQTAGFMASVFGSMLLLGFYRLYRGRKTI